MNALRRFFARIAASLGYGEKCTHCHEAFGWSRLIAIPQGDVWKGMCDECWHHVGMMILSEDVCREFAESRGIKKP